MPGDRSVISITVSPVPQSPGSYRSPTPATYSPHRQRNANLSSHPTHTRGDRRPSHRPDSPPRTSADGSPSTVQRPYPPARLDTNPLMGNTLLSPSPHCT